MPEPDPLDKLPPLPPGKVCLPWNLAYNIETLLRQVGLPTWADKVRACITSAEQAAQP